MSRTITARPLTREAFAEFGDVIDTDWANHYPINGGMTERYHDLAGIEAIGRNARVLISIFRGKPYAFPLELKLVERHPLGSQAFYPLSPHPFLVVVAPDVSGTPGMPRAFLTGPGQGVNIAMNTWHGVLTPLEADADFLCVDRGGEGSNLEEHFFPEPWLVQAT